MALSKKSPPAPKPQSRFGSLLNEIKGLIFMIISLGLGLMLFSWSPADPGWLSTVSSNDYVHNYLGYFGAYISQGILYLMGYSSWFIVLILLVRGLSLTRRTYQKLVLDPDFVLPRVEWEIWIGFAMVMISAMIIEASQFHDISSNLPGGAGGVIGISLASAMQSFIGVIPTNIFMIFVFLIGISLALKFSWFDIFEWVGAGLLGLFGYFSEVSEANADRKAGEAAIANRRSTAELEDDTEPEVSSSLPNPIDSILSTKNESESDIDYEVRIEPKLSKGGMNAGALPPNEPTIKPQKIVVKKAVSQQGLFLNGSSSVDLPSIDLLNPPSAEVETVTDETIEFTSRLIEKKLKDFGVDVKVVAAQPGPVITRYEIEPATGVRGTQIVNLSKDLARSLSLVRIRVVETILGKNLMGIELPNPRRQYVNICEIIGSEVYHKSPSLLTVVLGKDIAGNPIVADLAKMPHLLVAGTTGSGKSVGINAMILSILYKAKPDEVKLILIDPKMLEMSVYEGIQHLLAPVITNMSHAANALNWCVSEMERRYKLMSKVGTRNLAGYNNKVREAEAKGEPLTNPFTLTPEDPEPLEVLPMIVVIVDELADLMMQSGKKIEELIARLAQKARAAGIHLILATQRPSVDVITGLIKANIPTRISFQVSSKVDSRTILDQMGAESLLGQGDMLYLPPGSGLPLRVHGAFVADDEVARVVDFLKQQGEPDYVDGIIEGVSSSDGFDGGGFDGIDGEKDELYDRAVEIVISSRKASISFVQRQLRIGYNRAARLLEQMESSGIVSPMQSNNNRTVLVPGPNGEE